MSGALARAAAAGDLATVRKLLVAAPERARDWRPIMNAAFGGHAEVVQELLAHRAQVDARDQAGRTPLELACAKRLELARAKGHEKRSRSCALMAMRRTLERSR
jgi:ankyrin repeat protein